MNAYLKFTRCFKYYSSVNIIASKVIYSKMLPYQPHVYGAEEYEMAKSTSDIAISWQVLMHVRMLEFDSICNGQLFIARFKHLACLFSLNMSMQAVVKDAAPDKVQCQMKHDLISICQIKFCMAQDMRLLLLKVEQSAFTQAFSQACLASTNARIAFKWPNLPLTSRKPAVNHHTTGWWVWSWI